jgi:hypothetical protein
MDIIYLQLTNSFKEIRLYSMQALVEVVRCYYDFIADDIPKILQTTKVHVFNLIIKSFKVMMRQ